MKKRFSTISFFILAIAFMVAYLFTENEITSKLFYSLAFISLGAMFIANTVYKTTKVKKANSVGLIISCGLLVLLYAGIAIKTWMPNLNINLLDTNSPVFVWYSIIAYSGFICFTILIDISKPKEETKTVALEEKEICNNCCGGCLNGGECCSKEQKN